MLNQLQSSTIRITKHADCLDLQVTRHWRTTFDLVSEGGSAIYISCAVAGNINKTESLPFVKQDVEEGLGIKHNGAKIRMVCLEGPYEFFKLRVVLSNISAHLFYSLCSLLEEDGCTIGGRDSEE